MASWSSPRGRAYRDASPTSPLTPLSPSSLPQWLRAKRPRPGLLGTTRIKTVCIVLGCILLGWITTTSLGPSEDSALDADTEPYDIASGGVLTDPSGFGGQSEKEKSADGMIGTGEDEDTLYIDGGKDDTKNEPSVTGALSDLHHAVSDKLQSWNPYHNKPSQQSNPGPGANRTAAIDGKKKPTDVLAEVHSGEYIKGGMSEDDGLSARTRIGKCTMVFGEYHGNNHWERAIRTHERHDQLHGYRMHVLRQWLMDDVWGKPAYILSLLLRELSKPDSERLEWLFWVDADTIILNPYVPIEIFLPPPGEEFDDVYLVYSNDWNGLNNGVFAVRANQWAVELLSAIVSYRYFRPDVHLEFRDQSAMNYVMEEPKFAKNIVQVPQRWFNAYQGEHNETLAPFQIRRGDLLVHFAGVGDKEVRTKYWLDRAEQHLDDWEVPLKSTSYPAEAKDLWNEQRETRKNEKIKLSETWLKATQLLTATDERLKEYRDRLPLDQLSSIDESREALKKIIDDGSWTLNLTKVEVAMDVLNQASAPMNQAASSANQILLNGAHEAIFAGEKALLDGDFDHHGESQDLQQIHEKVKNLKNLVMSPDEFWSKEDITSATNAVTEARAKVQQIDPVAALGEARKMAQAEADQAVAEANGVAASKGIRPHLAAHIAAASAAANVHEVSSPPAQVSVAAAMSQASQVIVTASVVTIVPVPKVVAHVVTVTPEAVMVWTTATVTKRDIAAQTAAVEKEQA